MCMVKHQAHIQSNLSDHKSLSKSRICLVLLKTVEVASICIKVVASKSSLKNHGILVFIVLSLIG